MQLVGQDLRQNPDFAVRNYVQLQLDQTKQGDWYVFPVLINLQRLIKSSPEGVFGLIGNTLYKCFDPRRSNKTLGSHFDLNLEQTKLHSFVQSTQRECALDEFSEILEELFDLFNSSYKFLQIVFLLDEIEVTLDKDWTEILFNQLRSLIYQGSLKDYIRYVIVGSSRVIDVRERGSRLLNMLKIDSLKALAEKDVRKIINWASDVPLDVAQAVLEQCGGHPFVAQYLMHHLWEMGVSNTTVQSVIEVANKFIHERNADLDQWLKDIGKEGQLVYSFLAKSTSWLTEAELRRLISTPDLKVEKGLFTLCYHGLAIQDGTWSKYHYTGELFKGWFQNNIPLSLNVSELPITSSRSSLNKDPVVNRQLKASSSITTSKLPRTSAFISYSHKDKKFLGELHDHLKPYMREEDLDIWDDTRLLHGSNWREEIDKALQSAKVAILLISPNFLASDFIVNNELPSLLAAAKREEVVILSVILRPSAFEDTVLSQLHAVNLPSNPLIEMRPGKRDEVWSKVAKLVREALSKVEGS
jgi:hypothetical protein